MKSKIKGIFFTKKLKHPPIECPTPELKVCECLKKEYEKRKKEKGL